MMILTVIMIPRSSGSEGIDRRSSRGTRCATPRLFRPTISKSVSTSASETLLGKHVDFGENVYLNMIAQFVSLSEAALSTCQAFLSTQSAFLIELLLSCRVFFERTTRCISRPRLRFCISGWHSRWNQALARSDFVSRICILQYSSRRSLSHWRCSQLIRLKSGQL